MAGELEAQTILDVVPTAQRNRDRWPVEYHTPDVENFEPPVTAIQGSSAPPCPFGEITFLDNGDTAILGGLIIVGITTYTMASEKINLKNSGTFLYYIKVRATANTDDDSVIILPGISGSDTPDWGKTSDSNYPDGQYCEAADPDGILYIPIGEVTLELPRATNNDYTLSFVPAGCGLITISQCAGSLSAHR